MRVHNFNFKCQFNPGDLFKAQSLIIRREIILGCHVTSEKAKIKLRLKILRFYLYRLEDIFKRISAGLS